jgi:hypothetical protein
VVGLTRVQAVKVKERCPPIHSLISIRLLYGPPIPLGMAIGVGPYLVVALIILVVT